MARVIEHPNHQQALVMPLVAPEFGNLAGPPSLESCTRDVYAPSQRFTWTSTLPMAKGIASAAQHLHARGILHGDLYAHNIFHTAQGDALLSDFGAAAFFDVNDAAMAQGLEKLEVRALGCLLEELAMQCDATIKDATQHQALALLSQQCLQETPLSRPSLAQICTKLEALSK
jgi:serine/threonine protein kinase